MKSISTQSIRINAPCNKAFSYISNSLNQKERAMDFIKDVQQTNKGTIAATPFGEIHMEIITDEKQE